MSEIYNHGQHTTYDILYHFVWVTKYRYKMITDEVATRARELIRQSCEARNITILNGYVSSDHIHLHVSCPPELSPSKIAQYLKIRGSRLIQKEFPHLRKRYWGKAYVGQRLLLRNNRQGHRKDDCSLYRTTRNTSKR